MVSENEMLFGIYKITNSYPKNTKPHYTPQTPFIFDKNVTKNIYQTYHNIRHNKQP